MKDSRLDELGKMKQEKWEEKQSAYFEFKDAREDLRKAYIDRNDARSHLDESREILNHEFELLKENQAQRTAVWDEYKKERERINELIVPIQEEADREHREMVDCFEMANISYKAGDKDRASELSNEGHQHKERRNELNENIRQLAQQITEAKAKAMNLAPPHDRESFDEAREVFYRAKQDASDAEKRFNQLKDIRTEKRDAFKKAEIEFQTAREAFETRLQFVKDTNDRLIYSH